MLDFIAVVSWDALNRITKYQEFPNSAAAADHVAIYGGFVSARPAGAWFEWKVNGAGNALSRVPPPPPTPAPDRPEIVAIKRIAAATSLPVDISDLNL